MGFVTHVDFGVEWVDDFHADQCTQGNLGDSMQTNAYGFCNAMKVWGHTQKFNWGNDNAWERDFRHPDHGGDSLNWVDNVDFCHYFDHGGNWSDIMHIAFSKPMDHCLGRSDQWKLGVKKLKWLGLFACQGVPDLSSVIDVWAKSAHGLHMLFCFIGNASANSAVGADFGARVARGDTLGHAWLAAADQAGQPISIAFGKDSNEAFSRLFYETINWKYFDQQTLGYMAWMWIA